MTIIKQFNLYGKITEQHAKDIEEILENYIEEEIKKIKRETAEKEREKIKKIIKEMFCTVPKGTNRTSEINEENINQVLLYAGRFNYNKALEDILKELRKEIIKKQNEEFDEEFTNSTETYHIGWGVGDKDRLKFLSFIAKIRKETAEIVADKMTGKTVALDDEFSKEEKKISMEVFGTSETPECLRERRYGYNQRVEEEKEIKLLILKEL